MYGHCIVYFYFGDMIDCSITIDNTSKLQSIILLLQLCNIGLIYGPFSSCRKSAMTGNVNSQMMKYIS